MDKPLWQAETTIQLTDNFKENEDIIAFSIFGSTSSTENKFDFWSDIDGLLVVEDESFGKFSDNLKWIEFIESSLPTSINRANTLRLTD